MNAIYSYVEVEIIDCYYYDTIWFDKNTLIYICKIKNVDIFSNGLKVKIDDVTGQHENGYSNNNQVEAILIDGASNMKFFPSNIENVFSNLIFIRIGTSKLTHITNEDLKPFTKLKFLSLQYNLIEIIPENLFFYNQELEIIWLDHNQIKHIDKNVFRHLNKLRVLDLSENTCNSLGYAQTRNEVLDLVKKIEQGDCQLDITTISTTTTTTENPLKQEIKELKNHLSAKEKEIQNLSVSNMQKDTEIENMKYEIENLKRECQKCTTINESLSLILNKLDHLISSSTSHARKERKI
ncbi:hypothetical protein PVAND_009540 [Polypedilum vanderplanki]|uniref:Uncharacterized protein n=1 Tax=Polypedilum vanderplanki TaxID=319348 RepID=A0A9J6CDH8_POLVA|nr:hypothetical protein PVAND_009540 [Polypedilum vanderplanki]